MPPDTNAKPADKGSAATAFLIVDGSRVIPLDKPVVSIGRKKDNQIVLDSPHVSRYHAQIKKAAGFFVIVDLGSTVGTSVNGKRVEQVSLKPGDVISLGGVPIIFGQGAAKSVDEAIDALPHPAPDTGPTDATDIESVDDYLDLFEDNEA